MSTLFSASVTGTVTELFINNMLSSQWIILILYFYLILSSFIHMPIPHWFHYSSFITWPDIWKGKCPISSHAFIKKRSCTSLPPTINSRTHYSNLKLKFQYRCFLELLYMDKWIWGEMTSNNIFSIPNKYVFLFIYISMYSLQ
jgi:hypothetical protein